MIDLDVKSFSPEQRKNIEEVLQDLLIDLELANDYGKKGDTYLSLDHIKQALNQVDFMIRQLQGKPPLTYEMIVQRFREKKPV